MSSFHIWTIGCQMNVADSRRLAESLEQYGLTAAEGPHDADVVVLYSCVVRQGHSEFARRLRYNQGLHCDPVIWKQSAKLCDNRFRR